MKKKYKLRATLYDKKGKVLAVGHNSYVKTHPLQFEYSLKVGKPHGIFRHAELDAILKCRNIEEAHTMKVERYLNNGKEALAKPCAACRLLLKDFGIVNVEYTK